MTTYRAIQGMTVQSQTAASTAGQIWYDSANEVFKLQKVLTAAWATGGTRSNATFRGAAIGSTSAAVASGGTQTPPLPSGPINNTTELYNGTSWTGGNAAPLNLGYTTSGGTEAAGIVNTGESPPGSGTTTIHYASGTWTAGGTKTFAGQNSLGAGSQDNYICIGGVFQPSYAPQNNVATYNGTAWTARSTYPISIATGGCSGNADLAYAYGGDSPPAVATAADWSGTAWTTGTSMPTGTNNMAYNSAGPTTDVLSANGSPSTPTSLIYNGTSWSTTAATSQAPPQAVMAGATTSAGCVKWGGPGSNYQYTEEFTGGGPGSTTITVT